MAALTALLALGVALSVFVHWVAVILVACVVAAAAWLAGFWASGWDG